MPNVMAALPNICGALSKHSKVWLTPTILECHAVTLQIQENARLGRKVNFAPGQIPLGGKSPKKCIYSVPVQETAKHHATLVWLTSVQQRRCSNKAKTRNPLKFAGVLQTGKPISAANGPMFTIMREHVEEILLFNNFFQLSIGLYMP